MNRSNSNRKADLVVIGAGLAGAAATVFAATKGFKTIQVGLTAGQIPFASGALDLLGIYPTELQKRWVDPWAGIAALIEEKPEHPYSKVGMANIRTAWNRFLALLQNNGLKYCGWPERNAALVTCAGTIKTTYRVPETMWPGVLGLKNKRPALIIGFAGMKEFSSAQLVKTLGDRWPGLRYRKLNFPASFRGVDQQNLLLAESLDSPQVREALAEALLPFLEDAELVGMPAVLGLCQSQDVTADLERKLGVPVFEIPTMPPSLPGLRLKDAMDKEALKNNVEIISGRRAVAVEKNGRRCARVLVEAGLSQVSLESKGLILATGRFLGGGLIATRDGLREPLLDLYVHQPDDRLCWHRPSFFDFRGHPVNQAGLQVDDSFRPLGRDNQVVYENVFVAGSLLAHQDWVRMKCGAGLSIATAFAAVQGFSECI